MTWLNRPGVAWYAVCQLPGLLSPPVNVYGSAADWPWVSERVNHGDQVALLVAVTVGQLPVDHPDVPGRFPAVLMLQDSVPRHQDVDMTGDTPPTGNSPGPGAAELRASHEDRERAVDILRIAAGDGRLTAAPA
jgi:hypothetical protein